MKEVIDILYNVLTVNGKMTFVKCWFKNIERECSQIGSSSVIDVDLNFGQGAFSVNIDPRIVETLWGSGGKCEIFFIYS